METFKLGKWRAGDLADEVGARLVKPHQARVWLSLPDGGILGEVEAVWPLPEFALVVLDERNLRWHVAADVTLELCDAIAKGP